MPAWLGWLIWFIVLIFDPAAAMVLLVIALLLVPFKCGGVERPGSQRGPGE